MTIIQLSNLFDAVAAATTGISSYWFGWPSDRVRSRATNDSEEAEGAMYPRLLFAVPEMTQEPLNGRDTYDIQLFFDDLLGYDNDGEADDQTQLEKWRNLMNAATAWMKTLRSALPSLRPDGIQIVNSPRFILDSFAGQQRLISVSVSFQLATTTPCVPTINFPDDVPSGIPWPPVDLVIGEWVKAEQEFLEQATAVLTWTASNLDLTETYSIDVYMNGQRLLAQQYTLAADTVTIDADTHFEGSNYFVRSLWKI
jgi:hypothetical protein